MSFLRTRVTVVLNALDLERDDDSPAYLRKWVHTENYSQDVGGVTLEWPESGQEIFVPWSSIQSVRKTRCRCEECSQA